MRIIEKLAQEDRRISVLNLLNNVGIHEVRKIGVENSVGDYVAFVDADDWILPGMYDHMLREARQTNADIVLCGAASVSEDKAILPPKISFPERRVYEDDLLRRFCHFEFGSGVHWNKLYRRNLIREFLQPRISRKYGDGAEDYIVNFGCFAKASRVVTLPELYYQYFIRKDSVSRAVSNSKAFLRLLAAYVTCLETYYHTMREQVLLIDDLYTRQLRFMAYKVRSRSEFSGLEAGLCECLNRLAAVHPAGVYSLVHTFDISQHTPKSASNPLQTAMRQFVSSGIALARVVISWLKGTVST